MSNSGKVKRSKIELNVIKEECYEINVPALLVNGSTVVWSQNIRDLSVCFCITKTCTIGSTQGLELCWNVSWTSLVNLMVI